MDDFNGLLIPDVILKDKRLTSGEKVYLALSDRYDDATTDKLFRMGGGNIPDVRKNLISKGYING